MTETRAVLILGGARSGKSSYAQELVAGSSRRPVAIVTAEAGDAEMAARIEAHRTARPQHWPTVEAPLSLVEALDAARAPDRILLVDCLTLWLSNLFMAERNVEAETARLANWVARAGGPVVFVSNEVGGGIVPDTALGRAFQDAQGRLNQRMAQACSHVVLVTAGLPLQLKPSVPPQISV